MTDVLHAFGIDTVTQLNEKFKAKERDLNLNYRYGNTSEYYNIALENIRKIKDIHKEHLDETRFKLFYESAVNNDYYKTNPFYLLKSEYVVIATDIATKIKVEFPRMSNLYWSEEELKQTSPSHFVRASMSVPFFFEPMQKNIDATQESVKYAWRYWLNTTQQNICPAGIFIDGGSISNFPVDLFHNNDIFYPRLPVFGVKLTSDLDIIKDKGCSSKEVLRTPLSFSGNIISTLRGFNDKTFLTKYSFYDLYSIQTVDCGKSNWLNFFMKKEEKEDLFNRGFQSALDFLSKFDWEKYKYERMMVSMKDKKIMKEMDTPTVG
jgi:NTE family protein